jgi:class I fructose-bisphosphate aldolase
MKMTETVKEILSNYESDSPGTKTNLARILMTGKLAGTGRTDAQDPDGDNRPRG